jgi:GT2 family glycosyltransferase
MGAPRMFVSFIVPTYRRPEALRATLAALLDVDYPAEDLELIVVDDAAEDSTRALVKDFGEHHPHVVYLNHEGHGVAAARNHGARQARGELLIFLDDDIIVDPSHIRDHLATRESYGDCIVNGHWEFSPEVMESLRETPFGRFRIWVEDWVKKGIEKTPLEGACVEPEGVTACNLGIRRELFWELGGFDEEFPFAGCEDQEFSYRASRAGCRFVYNGDIRLLHNDRRLTLAQFGARQERGATTAVFLAGKHPEEYAERPLISENSPISRSDAPRVAAKKWLKSILSTRRALAVEHAAIALLERVHAPARVLRRLYWGICGLYIFRGVRAGLEARGAPGCRG